MGTYLNKPLTKKDTQESYFTIGQKKSQYCATGMQGWRLTMEDAELVKVNMAKDISIFGVFDGHGGSEVAQYVQQIFISELQKNQKFIAENYAQALIENFLKMDELLMTPNGKRDITEIKRRLSKEDKNIIPEDESMAGCTGNVCLITPKKIFVANAGDSRTIISSKGQPFALSVDHKPDDTAERDRIHKAGGEVWEGRVNGNLNLSRAIGDLEYKTDKTKKHDEQLIISKPDIKEWDFQKDGPVDFIVMGCDGIWECMENELIIKYFADGFKSGTQIKNLTEAFLDKIIAPDTTKLHGLDNMSIILINLNPK